MQQENKHQGKIAGVVVLYNPADEVAVNIATYIAFIDRLWVIDNSPSSDEQRGDFFRELHPKVFYFSANGNKGIATALNMACEEAFRQGFSWMLTMDQDSRFKSGEAEKFIEGLPVAAEAFPTMALLTPFHAVSDQFGKGGGSERYEEERSAMTSGNLLRLEAYVASGKFRDDFFMDYVDHEFCLRLRKNGYSVYCDTWISLEHSLGSFRVHGILGLKTGASHHSVERRYYITRNGLFTCLHYFGFDPVFCLKILKGQLTDFSKIILFEERKSKKLKAIGRGIWHLCKGRFGPLSI